tara:strand:+ start:227 stop:2086 length:1860 start_codon:yes stop_codon:yes gene_type:complete
MNLLDKYIIRKAVLVIVYSIGLLVSLVFAWLLRFDFAVPENLERVVLASALWIIPLKLFMFIVFHQYSGLLSFFSIRDLARLFSAIAGASLIICIFWFVFGISSYIPPRGVILIDFVLSFMGIASIRLAIRLYRERQKNNSIADHKKYKYVGIVGAGHSGANLAKDLFMRKSLGLVPKYFFDDDDRKWKSNLHGVTIIGHPEILLDKDFLHGLDRLIIALPAGATMRIKEIVKIANDVGLNCEIVPSVEELASGRVTVSKLRKVQIQDLLRREPVKLDADNIKSFIQNKVILVTGAGGSIGSELCRQIANYGARRLLLIEQCESQMFIVEQELIKLGHHSIIEPIIADILDSNRIDIIFNRYKPNIVFHAAAHKHVSLMERQPAEAFTNNTLGTINIADISVRYDVEHFLLVSTDKAINPTSVMGVTKRMAEVFIQSLSVGNLSTKFIAVRFGNVLGSSGSVVPIFDKQIEEGGPVTVAHPDVTRFFMTIPEAVGLILQAATQAQGGEIFVLNMGEAIKIIDLAKQLIELHGLTPGEDIEIKLVGLKPGEKLYEEVCHKGENLKETTHSEILRFISQPDNIIEVRQRMDEIAEKQLVLQPDQVKLLFKNFINEYDPYLR